MNNHKKIGVIDSGVGGLSILFHLIKMQNSCEFYYQSDHSNVPYGNKKQDFMYTQTAKMIEKLMGENVDLILIACNTLTAETIDKLRQEYHVPFVGIEPYVNYVNLLQNDKKAGLILTEATFHSKRFQSLRSKFDSNSKLEIFPLKNLALIIEEMQYKTIDNGLEQVKQELSGIKNCKLDTLLLGCTHYSLVGKYISELLGVEVLDPHLAVCKRVFDLLGLETLDLADFLDFPFSYAAEIDEAFEVKKLKDFAFFLSKFGIKY